MLLFDLPALGDLSSSVVVVSPGLQETIFFLQRAPLLDSLETLILESAERTEQDSPFAVTESEVKVIKLFLIILKIKA